MALRYQFDSCHPNLLGTAGPGGMELKRKDHAKLDELHVVKKAAHEWELAYTVSFTDTVLPNILYLSFSARDQIEQTLDGKFVKGVNHTLPVLLNAPNALGNISQLTGSGLAIDVLHRLVELIPSGRAEVLPLITWIGSGGSVDDVATLADGEACLDQLCEAAKMPVPDGSRHDEWLKSLTTTQGLPSLLPYFVLDASTCEHQKDLCERAALALRSMAGAEEHGSMRGNSCVFECWAKVSQLLDVPHLAVSKSHDVSVPLEAMGTLAAKGIPFSSILREVFGKTVACERILPFVRSIDVAMRGTDAISLLVKVLKALNEAAALSSEESNDIAVTDKFARAVFSAVSPPWVGHSVLATTSNDYLRSTIEVLSTAFQVTDAAGASTNAPLSAQERLFQSLKHCFAAEIKAGDVWRLLQHVLMLEHASSPFTDSLKQLALPQLFDSMENIACTWQDLIIARVGNALRVKKFCAMLHEACNAVNYTLSVKRYETYAYPDWFGRVVNETGFEMELTAKNNAFFKEAVLTLGGSFEHLEGVSDCIRPLLTFVQCAKEPLIDLCVLGSDAVKDVAEAATLLRKDTNLMQLKVALDGIHNGVYSEFRSGCKSLRVHFQQYFEMRCRHQATEEKFPFAETLEAIHIMFDLLVLPLGDDARATSARNMNQTFEALEPVFEPFLVLSRMKDYERIRSFSTPRELRSVVSGLSKISAALYSSTTELSSRMFEKLFELHGSQVQDSAVALGIIDDLTTSAAKSKDKTITKIQPALTQVHGLLSSFVKAGGKGASDPAQCVKHILGFVQPLVSTKNVEGRAVLSIVTEILAHSEIPTQSDEEMVLEALSGLLTQPILLANSECLAKLAACRLAQQPSPQAKNSFALTISSIDSVGKMAEALSTIVSGSSNALPDLHAAQPLLYALALFFFTPSPDMQCATLLAMIGVSQLDKRHLLWQKSSIEDFVARKGAERSGSPNKLLEREASVSGPASASDQEVHEQPSPNPSGSFVPIVLEPHRSDMLFAERFEIDDTHRHLLRANQETDYEELLGRLIEQVEQDLKSKVKNAYEALRTDAFRRSSGAADDVSEMLTARDLLLGVPVVIGASESWRVVFGSMIILGQAGDAKGIDGGDAERNLMLGYLKAGATLLCLLDMVLKQLHVIGDQARAGRLSEEFELLYKLLRSLEVPDGKESPSVSKLLRELRSDVADAEELDEEENDKGNLQNKLKQEKQLRLIKNVQESHNAAHIDDEDDDYNVVIDSVDDAAQHLQLKLGMVSEADLFDDDGTSGSTSGKRRNEKKMLTGDGGPGPSGSHEGQNDSRRPNAPTRQTSDHAKLARQDALRELDEVVIDDDMQSQMASKKPAHTQQVEVDFDLAMSGFLKKFENDSSLQQALYKQRNSDSTGPIGAQVMKRTNDLEEMDAPEKWTYELLANDPSIKDMVQVMLAQARLTLSQGLKSRSPPRIQWCVVLDSSGSMSKIKNQLAEASVMLVELFRRLEMSFAVATLGDALRARVLKRLNEPFTYKVGERVLAGMTYNESTQIIESLNAICADIFGVKEADAVRVMIIVTDGLSSDGNFQAGLTNVRDEYNLFGIGFLHTKLDFHASTKDDLERQTADLDSAMRAIKSAKCRYYQVTPPPPNLSSSLAAIRICFHLQTRFLTSVSTTALGVAAGNGDQKY